MSKTSHQRHEHKEHPHHHSVATDEIPPSFFERHKILVWVIVVIFFIAAPIVFAALTVLGLFR